ncbi:MAG: glycosyltransferase family 4 protein, partial [Verrucomicrobiia bacterium]
MHILFLSHYFPPETNAPASRTYEHARRWVQKDGIRVTVVTNHPNHPNGVLFPGYRNRWLTIEERDGISVRRVKTFVAPNAGFLRRTLNYVWFMVAGFIGATRVAKPDVVVATSPQFFCAVAGWVASCWHRCPFVFEVRDLWPDSIVTVGAMRRGVVIRALERLELFLYSQAEKVVVLTDAFRENLLKRGVPAEKIAVIKNGVDLSFFRPRSMPAMLRQELGLEGRFVVSYIGTLGMAHAVDRIVEVADLLRAEQDLMFVLVGDGAERKRVENMVREKRLTNVRVLPGVSKESVCDYYAVSDLGLVTLRNKELFRTVLPSKVFEWMAMARPILCAVQGECRALLSAAGAAVFAEPEDVKGMAEAILRLRKDQDQ